MRLQGSPVTAMPTATDVMLYLAVLPLSILIGDPLGEELGFRGYALPGLMRRHSTLVAVAILWVGHLVWHLPLFFATDPPHLRRSPSACSAEERPSRWLLNATRNIVMVMILHGEFNAAQQQFLGGFTGADSQRAQLHVAIGWALTATVVIWHTGGTLLPRKGSTTAAPLDLPPDHTAPAPTHSPAEAP